MSLFKRGKYYWISLTLPGGDRLRQSTGCVTQEDALRCEAALRLQAHNVTRLPSAPPVSDNPVSPPAPPELSPKLSDMLEAYYQRQAALNRRSLHSAIMGCDVALRRGFPNARLADITPEAVERFINDRLTSGRATRTVNKDVSYLGRVFELARRQGLWRGDDPTEGIKKLREGQNRERFLTPTEQQRLLAACNDRLRHLVLAALRTGMRRGELTHLQVRDVSLDPGKMWVVASGSKVGRQRVVPMVPEVAELFAKLVAGREPEDYVFLNADGNAYFDPHIAFRRACKKAGLDDVRFHDLRHTFASDLVAAGADLYVVSRLLGHSRIQTTTIYAHLREDKTRAAVKQLSTWLEAQARLSSRFRHSKL